MQAESATDKTLVTLCCQDAEHAKMESEADESGVDYTITHSEHSFESNLRLIDCIGESNGKQGRRRLRHDERQILENEFLKKSNWSATDIKRIAKRLNFSYAKVYKWNFDHKKVLAFESTNKIISTVSELWEDVWLHTD